jgi:16S rRNA (guanine527-N7)-methyltransferase
VELIHKYFKGLDETQVQRFTRLYDLYQEWNQKINVISRKDIDALYEKHILHSLAIARFISFKPGTRVLDLGTGGGFPGLPLAILFPEVTFTLCDSIAKKIRVAEEVAEAIGLTNTDMVVGRVEMLKESFHFICSRAVAPTAQLYTWTKGYIDEKNFNPRLNGYILLKGGDLRPELAELKTLNRRLLAEEHSLGEYFEEPFFAEKKLLYIYGF